jgi:predicted small lipoprotein YifL
MKKTAWFLIAGFSLGLLCACGQKGPLYLPTDKSAPTQGPRK